MPLYDYQCKGCGAVVEKSVPWEKRDDHMACPSCEGELGRLMSAPKIVSGVKGPQSAPDSFKDVLRTIKKSSGKGNTIDV